MNEFIKVLIERLEEEPYEKDGGELFLNENLVDCLPLRKVEEIVNQLAEEHKEKMVVVEEDKLLQLSVAERLALANTLIDSVVRESEYQLIRDTLSRCMETITKCWELIK